MTLRGHTDFVTSVAWSPDRKRLASGSMDKTVKVWDAVTGEVLLNLRGREHVHQSVAWSPDGQRIASLGTDRGILIWMPSQARKS